MRPQMKLRDFRPEVISFLVMESFNRMWLDNPNASFYNEPKDINEKTCDARMA